MPVRQKYYRYGLLLSPLRTGTGQLCSLSTRIFSPRPPKPQNKIFKAAPDIYCNCILIPEALRVYNILQPATVTVPVGSLQHHYNRFYCTVPIVIGYRAFDKYPRTVPGTTARLVYCTRRALYLPLSLVLVTWYLV
jgi:hypothetical protein